MQKNRYNSAALKEATSIVEKCMKRNSKKLKYSKLIFIVSFVIIVGMICFYFIK